VKKQVIAMLIAYWYLIINAVATISISPFMGDWKLTRHLLVPIGIISSTIMWRMGDKFSRLTLFALCIFKAGMILLGTGLIFSVIKLADRGWGQLLRALSPLFIMYLADACIMIAISIIVVAYRRKLE